MSTPNPNAGLQAPARIAVLVIDPDPKRREILNRALAAFYRVSEFPDVETAIGMTKSPPSALLVDESARPPRGRELIRSLREHLFFRGLPIIMTTAGDSHPKRGVDLEPDTVLPRPFSRSTLVDVITRQLNKVAEGEWELLPANPREALRQSLSTFNGIADLIERSEGLDYTVVTTACTPVLDAVTGSDYKHILKGLRRHESYFFVHSLRMATLLSLFGYNIGLKDEALMILACGGLIHDVGKMSVAHEVLNKTGKLTAEEWDILRGHVDNTVNYLRRHSNVPKGVLTIAAHHHEKLDGTGYPHGLQGDKLNDLSRMSAIVDVFAALTERRAYKTPIAPEKALAIMTEEMAGGLDQRLLRLFRDMLLDAAVEN